VKVDVTELSDANPLECRRKALERYADLADDSFTRLVKARTENPSSQRTCAESKKFTPGE
jgi:hypothetical protein